MYPGRDVMRNSTYCKVPLTMRRLYKFTFAVTHTYMYVAQLEPVEEIIIITCLQFQALEGSQAVYTETVAMLTYVRVPMWRGFPKPLRKGDALVHALACSHIT